MSGLGERGKGGHLGPPFLPFRENMCVGRGDGRVILAAPLGWREEGEPNLGRRVQKRNKVVEQRRDAPAGEESLGVRSSPASP